MLLKIIIQLSTQASFILHLDNHVSETCLTRVTWDTYTALGHVYNMGTL